MTLQEIIHLIAKLMYLAGPPGFVGIIVIALLAPQLQKMMMSNKGVVRKLGYLVAGLSIVSMCLWLGLMVLWAIAMSVRIMGDYSTNWWRTLLSLF